MNIFVKSLILLLSSSDNFLKINAFTISQIYGEEFLEHWNIYVTGPYGTTSQKDGEFFTDFKQSLNGRSVEPSHWPSGINIRSGGSIDAIQIFYGNYRGRLHGWQDGGSLHKIRLYEGDKIVKITGRRGLGPGATVDQLTFHSSLGHVFGPYGGTGGYRFTAQPPKSDCYLSWISGQAHLKVDSISFHWRCPSTFVSLKDKDYVEEMLSNEYSNSKSFSVICQGSYQRLWIFLVMVTLLLI